MSKILTTSETTGDVRIILDSREKGIVTYSIRPFEVLLMSKLPSESGDHHVKMPRSPSFIMLRSALWSES